MAFIIKNVSVRYYSLHHNCLLLCMISLHYAFTMFAVLSPGLQEVLF